MTQTVTRGNHKWESNAAERQISDHTRHCIEILGRLEDTYGEIYDLVEATGVTSKEDIDNYLNSTMESFSAFRAEVRKLMLDNITENLECMQGDI